MTTNTIELDVQTVNIDVISEGFDLNFDKIKLLNEQDDIKVFDNKEEFFEYLYSDADDKRELLKKFNQMANLSVNDLKGFQNVGDLMVDKLNGLLLEDGRVVYIFGYSPLTRVNGIIIDVCAVADAFGLTILKLEELIKEGEFYAFKDAKEFFEYRFEEAPKEKLIQIIADWSTSNKEDMYHYNNILEIEVNEYGAFLSDEGYIVCGKELSIVQSK